MKTISKSAKRQKAVANVLASLRIEQLTPSPSVVSGLRTCIAGNVTTDKLLADVMSRHVALRRV
ncbi:MAG: antitoxin VbhA family protein [Azonexus sp.]|jgi:hypothetical protein|nr:antitoxin VbhA family protein [Betaproteobacteria bacterium]MBK7898874.1 antitoxin VbhA family protein [Betaproteobacteria bacterium]MBK8917245.1 antitoxin VbhA family protein [Betaproteobacteria bacterium]MBP6035008.1 antitoxin VbhA family protein [Azonexus sp.]MBP6906014.1 antitoxin VbhA family protein [Azonexus sp.]